MTETNHTIEFVHGNYWLCRRGVYEESSVLAGQDFRQLCKSYESLEEAQLENPDIEISDEGKPISFMPQTAPDWFDPMDAGEVWSEEDY